MSKQFSSAQKTVTAVLGPTNTGKTYLAMDRLLSYSSGIIGFPLRLLARENYERAVALKGTNKVALITGEEKIIPPNAMYFICTVESMPLEKEVEFLAVDEIQLAADRERGHVFTDRILNSRGCIETMFLGSETIKGLVQKLVPNVKFVKRSRFSSLRYSGVKNITKLPKRTAIVAFSVSDLYGIADLLRRKRGGTAIVMGALSPRTRNAQVSLYQSGEVDYMVATDAIGMGLNMDVNHVAFSSLVKFDGKKRRPLGVPELSQIAGRAGRYMNDGTFGVTQEEHTLGPETVKRIENHNLPPIKSLFWRNTELNYDSVDDLTFSLRRPPVLSCLRSSPQNEDFLNLGCLLLHDIVMERAIEPDNVELLWEVAQIPDFRKSRPDVHSRFLLQLYDKLTSDTHTIPENWIANAISNLTKTDGDITTLMDRIAGIRTWNYIANRSNWLDQNSYWQARVREVENNISDALHEKLTQQFIDHRTSYLMSKTARKEPLAIKVTSDDLVYAGAHYIGRINGFIFEPDKMAEQEVSKVISSLSQGPLTKELQYRVQMMRMDDDTFFKLGNDSKFYWRGSVVGFLTKSANILDPTVGVCADIALKMSTKVTLIKRLELFLDSYISTHLKPLMKMQTIEMKGAASGLLFQLISGLGTIATVDARLQVRELTAFERKTFSRHGVRFGVQHIYVTALLKPASVSLRSLLWNLFHGTEKMMGIPEGGRVSFPVTSGYLRNYYLACGFYSISTKAYRVDVLETFLARIRGLQRKKISILPANELSILGINNDDAVELLASLGVSVNITQKGINIHNLKKKNSLSRIQRVGKKPTKVRGNNRDVAPRLSSATSSMDPDSPFFSLKKLLSHGG